MDIVIDTSALIAVLVAEPERNRIIELTSGHTLLGPGSIPWEVGNAFSVMLKHHRLELDDAQRGLEIMAAIPLRYVSVDMANAMTIAQKMNMYAYDAYLLDCALRFNAPLLTLDKPLKRIAERIGVKLVEV